MKVYVFATLVLVAIFSCEARVELRLVGKHKYEGRVEAFVNGEWGPVSARSWNKKAAQVVCRQLGFNGQVIRSTGGLIYGHPMRNVPVWLRKISCHGNETELDQCKHSGWVLTMPRLNFYDLAGVICYTDKGREILPQMSEATRYVHGIEKNSLKVRLDGKIVDGIISEGFLTVGYKEKWGHVCADEWDEKDARVACGQLGFPEAVESKRMSVENKIKARVVLRNVDCLGHESSLFSCEHGGLGDNLECAHGKVVWLKCKVFERTNEFKNSVKLKLRGGALPSSGRVEVFHKSRKITSWCTLCDDHWNLKTANVVCRNLGYGTAEKAFRAATFGQGSLSVFVEAIMCTGLENTIAKCKWTVLDKSNCSHFEDAGVACNIPRYHKHEVRLRGGMNDSEGRVEVYKNGKWGTICADNWGMRAAMMVCRELKSNFAQVVIKGKQFGVGAGVVMNGPICFGDERSLTQCLHDDNVTCSSPENVAAVQCTDALPDLALSIWELSGTLIITYMPCNYLKCSFEENCLASSATPQMAYGTLYRRRLMRFSTKIFNLGFADYRPWAKKEDWIWHSCHKHYHSQEEFAIYDLLTKDNRRVAEGHKASFCLEDTKCLPGVETKYNCTAGTQGISMNCFDNYPYDIDCQWIDVTDVPISRYYTLQVNINPKLIVAETDFDNNVIRCAIMDRGSNVRVLSCQYDYCTSGLRSHGGNANNACCVFPFRYKGKIYKSCTKAGYHKYWCATSSIYDRKKRWGLC